MLYNMIIGPVETVVGWVFTFILNHIPQVGVIGAVFGVSIAVNFLALPLYNIAEALQEKERNVVKSLEYRVRRIKEVFKGDERFMMLSIYYEQNGYHPLYALRSSLSILIELPFFIAAYHYLSNCEALKEVSFWVFKDLGAADGLLGLHAFGRHIHINVLPVIMTLINCVSGAIYTRDVPLKEKIQQYAVALIFLFLLYKSPSGLVIYWIMNNTFSLLKNVVNKILKPTSPDEKAKRPVAIGKHIPDTRCFFMLLFSGLILSLIAGVLLPASIFLQNVSFFLFNPNEYFELCFFTALGFFVFWPVCIYKLFNTAVKEAVTVILFVFFAVGTMDLLLFHSDYSSVTPFSFAVPSVRLKVLEFILPVAAVIMAFLLLILSFRFSKTSILAVVLALSLVVTGVLSAVRYYKLCNTDYKDSCAETISYLNSFPPEKIMRMRMESYEQMKNFVASQLLPPFLRRTSHADNQEGL